MMSYLEQMQNHITQKNFIKLKQLWEEYCTGSDVDTEEFRNILVMIKDSDFAKDFGTLVEMALPIWQEIKDDETSYQIFKLIIDIQTTNTPQLADLAIEKLKKRYPDDSKFTERLRLVGLRTRENFQHALSSYDLLAHLEKGKCVYHTGGWGTGEIMDVSILREQISLEFENVTGLRQLTFANAFKILVPLPATHFLSRRFTQPEQLEVEAKKNPVEVVKSLLRDLGPKTAAQMRDELSGIVIPDSEWSKWWQMARNKLKQETLIESPDNAQIPYRLRTTAVSPGEAMIKKLDALNTPNEVLPAIYNFARDFPQAVKIEEVRQALKNKLLGVMETSKLTPAVEIQILLLLEEFLGHKTDKTAASIITSLNDIIEKVSEVEILALKKRVLMIIREQRPDWKEIFLNLLFSIQPNQLRDYVLKELNNNETIQQLEGKLKQLLLTPETNPEGFVWYFQKIVKEEETDIPYANKEGQVQFLESFLMLLHKVEQHAQYKELAKKMANMLTDGRYALVRAIIQGTDVEFLKEFLLLTSKCQTLSENDKRTFHSLAQVVQPSLAPVRKKGAHFDVHAVWTTEEGYNKVRNRLHEIATVEMVKNAREVEVARAHGDLRENAEYKAAVERRSQLQGEMRRLSHQVNKARVITIDDITTDEVGIGSIVDVEDSEGSKVTYTILGPWDANADNYVISFQSLMAQAMFGSQIGDTFSFKDRVYKVVNIQSFLK